MPFQTSKIKTSNTGKEMSLDENSIGSSDDDDEKNALAKDEKYKSFQRKYHINSENNATIFHVACAEGNLEIVKYCVKEGFDLYLKIHPEEITDDFISYTRVTGFDFACLEGHVDIVKFLLQTELDLSRLNSIMVLEYATLSKNTTLVKFLLSEGFGNDLSTPDFSRLLHQACRNDDLETAKLYLAKGADIDYNDGFGSSFNYACEATTGNTNLVKFLVNQRCDMTSTDEIVFRNTGFHVACQVGNLNIVKFLIQKGFDKNMDNAQGGKGYHLACSSGNVNIVHYFIQNGFDINTVDDGGCTGLHYACSNCTKGAYKVVQYLVRNGCDMNAVDHVGETAFHNACSNCFDGNLSTIQFLLNAGFDRLNQKNLNGETGLMLMLLNPIGIYQSVQAGEEDLLPIVILLEAGAEFPQNETIPFQMKGAVQNRIIEITFIKDKIFEKFTERIAQVILDFTMQPFRNTSLQNLSNFLLHFLC
jgi:ankyrin repeat protein